MGMMKHMTRVLLAVAASLSLALAACGDDDGDGGAAPPATSGGSADGGSTPPTTPPGSVPPTTAPPTTAPPTTEPPTSAPPTTAPPTSAPVAPGRLEGIPTVIEDEGGPRMCFEVLESFPPQCGTGLELVGWSWDAIDVEQVDGATRWVDRIYVAGTYDEAYETFTVDEVRLPTDADRERILMSAPLPDHSVPCPAPEGGWPERTQEWPEADVAALPGYAGSWQNEPGVVTVKFTGDLAAAESAVRERFDGPLCVVEATRDLDELSAIAEQLRSMSSVRFLSVQTWVDASGEWVQAQTIAPDPARQAALDEEFGSGVVRLVSLLRPLEADAEI